MTPFHLPTNSGNADVQVFSTNESGTYDTYVVPPGKSNLFIYIVGSGGGGGGGFSGAAGTARGGGGGGAAASQGRYMFQTALIPQTLFVFAPQGGPGGAAATDGTPGAESVVLISQHSPYSRTNVLASSGTTATSFGRAGTATAGGIGGLLPTAPVAADAPRAGIGLLIGSSGVAGAAGGAHTGAVGGAQNIPATGTNVIGGTGGAGTTSADFAGGQIQNIADSLLARYRPATPAAGSFDGSGGFSLANYMFHFPGLGGSASNTGVGGNGGNGGYGCGGGGGGAGTTGGRGGNGGSGLVVMIAW